MTSSYQHLSAKQPYPGLRAYRHDEADIFFGREEQVNRMLSRLEDNRFLAVVGSSGSGKSSLVRAGLLPALQQGYLLVTGDSECSGQDWLFITIKPGKDPYKELAREWVNALHNVNNLPCNGKEQEIVFSQAILEAGPKGLSDLVKENKLNSSQSILLLVDQFEEVFRFQSSAYQGSSPKGNEAETQRNKAKAFVNLLLTTFRMSAEGNTTHPIYVVITMRSDFIGNCERFIDLPQVVSDSQFLVPLMTRDQMREAIEKPLQPFGWRAEPDLVNQILNDIASSTEQLFRASADQLPLMQHALMRTWFTAKARLHNEKTITLCDYQQIGGMTTALLKHLDEAYASLQDPQQHTDTDVGSCPDSPQQIVAQSLFMSLCERNNEGQLIRRPVVLRAAAEVAGVNVKTVSDVVDVFQRDERNFILSTPSGDQPDDAILDISHEALLRQWKTLTEWFEHESKSAENYRRLFNHALLRKDDSSHFLTGLELTQAEDWEKTLLTKTAAWGNRYIPDDLNNDSTNYAQVVALIRASQQERQRRKDIEENERKEKERRLIEERDRQRHQKRLSVLFSIGVTWLAYYIWTTSMEGTIKQERLFLSNADSAVNKDPFRAISYTLAALEIQPRLPFSSSKISTVVRDILSTAIASPRQLGFPKADGHTSTPMHDSQLPYTGAGPIWSVLISKNDDRIFSGAADGSVNIWNQKDGTRFASNYQSDKQPKLSQVLNLIQVGNGELISGEADGRLRRWIRSDNTIQQKWESMEDDSRQPVISLIKLTDDEFVSGDSNGTVKWWRDQGTAVKLIKSVNSRQITVNSLVRIGNNEFYSAGQDGSIVHWQDRAEVNRLNTPDPVRSMVSLSDRELIIGNMFSQIRKWDLKSNRPLSEPISTSQASVRSMIRLGGGKFLTAGTDGTFMLWQSNMRPLSQPMESGQAAILGLAVTEDGRTLYTGGSDGSVRRWDLSHVDGEFKTIITNPKHEFSHILMLSSGQVLTGNGEGILEWWDSCGSAKTSQQPLSNQLFCQEENATLKRSIQTKQGEILSMLELPFTNNLITAGSNGTLALWSGEGKPKKAPIASTQGNVNFILPFIKQADRNQVITISQQGQDVFLRQRSADLKEIKKSIERRGVGSIKTAIILQNGDIVLGSESGKVHRLNMDGATTFKPISTADYPCKENTNKPSRGSPILSLLELRNGRGLLAGDADGCILHIQKQQANHVNIARSYKLSDSSLTGMQENDNDELLISSNNGSIYILHKDPLNTLVTDIKTGLGSVTFLGVNGKNGKGELIAGWHEGKKLIVRRWQDQDILLKQACEMLGYATWPPNRSRSWMAGFWSWLPSTKWFNTPRISSPKQRFQATMNDLNRKEQEFVDNLALKFCRTR